MRHIRRRELTLALALAAMAGYLDAVGVRYLGGYFVSFMSGNSTRAAADATGGHWAETGKAAGLFHVGVPAFLVVAVAMGTLNSTFQRNGEVSIGLTYMTGTLVKAGQQLVAALFGEAGRGWLRYAALWLALSAGAVLGGVAFSRAPSSVLWIAAAALAATTGVTSVVRRREARRPSRC